MKKSYFTPLLCVTIIYMHKRTYPEIPGCYLSELRALDANEGRNTQSSLKVLVDKTVIHPLHAVCGMLTQIQKSFRHTILFSSLRAAHPRSLGLYMSKLTELGPFFKKHKIISMGRKKEDTHVWRVAQVSTCYFLSLTGFAGRSRHNHAREHVWTIFQLFTSQTPPTDF